jgi:hypothetical protein
VEAKKNHPTPVTTAPLNSPLMYFAAFEYIEFFIAHRPGILYFLDGGGGGLMIIIFSSIMFIPCRCLMLNVSIINCKVILFL